MDAALLPGRCGLAAVRPNPARQGATVHFTLATGGPARYYRIPESETRVGFISPHSHNFCGDCNRVRVTAEGRLLLCLGQEHSLDLRAILRSHPGDAARLEHGIREAMQIVLRQHPTELRWSGRTGTTLFAMAAKRLPAGDIRSRAVPAMLELARAGRRGRLRPVRDGACGTVVGWRAAECRAGKKSRPGHR